MTVLAISNILSANANNRRIHKQADVYATNTFCISQRSGEIMILCMLLALVSWQQHVSYDIIGNLNTDEHSFTATEHLIYYNNSPHSLDTLYMRLYANAYRDAKTYYALEAHKTGDEAYVKAQPEARGYIDVTKITSSGESLQYDIDETVMAVPLNQRLNAGASLVLEIEFYVKIPKEFPEFGYGFEHYEMTQWYPKMCVFDEKGWHNELLHPLGGAYGEFGTYDVTIQLPGDYVVAGTGKQIDPLETQFLDTLIATGRKLPRGNLKTVHFHAEKVHDFAWVCDKDFGVAQYAVGSTNIYVFYKSAKKEYGEKTFLYAESVISRFGRWFGEYAYGDLNFVEGFHQGKATYPQMIIMSLNEDNLTRLFETKLVMDIGKQWFNGVIGLDGMRDAWLGEGLATHAAIRYMEDKYGKDNTLIKTRFFPPLSLKYFHRAHYYLNQTNQLEKPVSTPAYEYIDVPISYENSVNSKPALFLFSFEKIVGEEEFYKIMQRYYKTYTFKHAKPYEFVKICEEVSGQDLAGIFDAFLNTTEFCDWAVKSVSGSKVEIENKGNLKIPVDLHIITDSGDVVFPIDAQEKKYTVVVPDTLGEVKKVVLDPLEYTLDPDYWNNYSPRRVSIKSIFDFDWPSFSTYQILWSPYLWYNTYDGMKAGVYLFGDKFADFDFVKGGDQVTAGYARAFGSRRDYPLLNYQTPVLFRDGLRVRFRFNGSRSRGGDHISIGFLSSLGRPLTKNPPIEITNMFSYCGLFTYAGVDSIDWDLGKNLTVENNLRFRRSKLNIDIGLSFAHHALGSDWQYFKSTFEIRRSFELGLPFSVRFFIGKVFGDTPVHEKLFLSGVLQTNWLADLLFGQSGQYSPQERIHIPGDGNMCGYQTLHIKFDQMYVLNLEFPARSLIRIFSDIGYYDRFALDAGVRLVIGTEMLSALPINGLSISLNLPLYTYLEDEPWKLRWSFGFSL